ncbi:MAG: MFS transporter [Anaerolineae bacterium]
MRLGVSTSNRLRPHRAERQCSARRSFQFLPHRVTWEAFPSVHQQYTLYAAFTGSVFCASPYRIGYTQFNPRLRKLITLIVMIAPANSVVTGFRRCCVSPRLTNQGFSLLVDRRRVITIFLIVFVNFLGASIVQPVLPLYAGSRFGARPETIAWLLASYFIAQFIAAPFLGRLSDRYGRLPVLIVSQIGTVISFLLLAGADALPMLFFARILDGITGGNVIVAQAYLTDLSTPKTRMQALGVVFTAFGLGYVLGPAVGGIIAALFSDRAAFLVASAVSLSTVILTAVTLKETLTPEIRRQRRDHPQAKLGFHEVFTNTSLLFTMGIGFAAQFSIALLTSTIALYGEAVIFAGQSLNNISFGNGLILSGFGVGQIITQLYLVKWLAPRFGEKRLIIAGTIFRGLGMLFIVMIASPYWIGGVAMPLVAIASGVMMPAVQTLATTSVSAEVSGGALGWYQSAATMGIIFGTALGGQLFASSPSLPFMVGGCLLIVLVVPAYLLTRIHRPYADPAGLSAENAPAEAAIAHA